MQVVQTTIASECMMVSTTTHWLPYIKTCKDRYKHMREKQVLRLYLYGLSQKIHAISHLLKISLNLKTVNQNPVSHYLRLRILHNFLTSLVQ